MPCAALSFALLLPVAGRADIVITAQSVSAATPSTGNVFDVVLQNTGPDPINVSAFDFEISTTDTDITFTSASTSTTATYIFSGHSLFGPTINTSSGQTLEASDLYDVIASGANVASGATVGLGRVSFDVATGATPGPFAVTLTPDPGTSLSDADGDSIAINSLVSGQITIQGNAVPEPGGLALFPMLLIGCALWVRRKGRLLRSPV